jgi:hypothetical protein
MPDSSPSRPPSAVTTSRREDKSLPTLVTELWELLVSYIKQETVGPLRGLRRFLAFGIAGAVLTSIGLVLLTIAGLRAIQTETNFTGHLSWLPYLIVIAAAGLVAALSARAITRPMRKKER